MTNMRKAYRTAFAGRRGFTLIELIIVLVVIGLIIMLGVPLVGQLVKQNKLAEDRATVLEAKTTLIGYGQARAGYPSPDTGNLLPHATLSMRGADAEGNKLVYDVNDQLTVTATGGNLTTFCLNVILEIANNSPPKIWNATDFSNPANSASVAFVVYSRGPNFTADRQNTPVPGDRLYENPATAFTDTYQDVVAAYSLFDLKTWCGTNAPGVQLCDTTDNDKDKDGKDDDDKDKDAQGGQKQIRWSIKNTGSSAHSFAVASGDPNSSPPPEASSCLVVNPGQTINSAECEIEEHHMGVWSATNCKSVFLMNRTKLKDLDTNKDGIAAVTCNDSSCTFQ